MLALAARDPTEGVPDIAFHPPRPSPVVACDPPIGIPDVAQIRTWASSPSREVGGIDPHSGIGAEIAAQACDGPAICAASRTPNFYGLAVLPDFLCVCVAQRAGAVLKAGVH